MCCLRCNSLRSPQDTHAINVYLLDGSTWQRLKAIATQPTNMGGLNLMKEGSRQYKWLFSKSPPKIIDERPECYAEFLRWLIPRQTQLMPLVERDLELRTLKMPQAARALASLRCIKAGALRCIDYVMIKKGLHVFYFVKGRHSMMEGEEGMYLHELAETAANIITSREADPAVLKAIDLDIETLKDLGFRPQDPQVNMTWFDVTNVLIQGLDPETSEELMPLIYGYHERVTQRMASHLLINAEQISRTLTILAYLFRSSLNSHVVGCLTWCIHHVGSTR